MREFHFINYKIEFVHKPFSALITRSLTNSKFLGLCIPWMSEHFPTQLLKAIGTRPKYLDHPIR